MYEGRACTRNDASTSTIATKHATADAKITAATNAAADASDAGHAARTQHAARFGRSPCCQHGSNAWSSTGATYGHDGAIGLEQ